MYGGLQPGFWNDGAHGVITVKPGNEDQYVHVVTSRDDLVRLRDNGYRVTAVTDLRTGERMRFSQSGGYLTILWHHELGHLRHGVQGGDRRAAVLLRPRPRQGDRVVGDGHPAANLVDGSYETTGTAGAQLPGLGDARPRQAADGRTSR
jgi:hypothetical protein